MNAKNRNKSIVRQTAANIAASVIYQITAAVCSLILPRYILLSFGSDVNGILQSVSQLLNYTVIMECGIGGLIMAAFYKPLADGDKRAVSDIFNYSRGFFNKLSYVYMGLVLMLAVLAKVIIRTEYDFSYVSTLTLILGVSYYFTYYFALTHRLLIRADQNIRIVKHNAYFKHGYMCCRYTPRLRNPYRKSCECDCISAESRCVQTVC